jgi:hypothetical protein
MSELDLALRPERSEYAEWFERYISRVPDGSIVETLSRQLASTEALLRGLSAERARFSYAPGKWTVAEVIGHVADSERVFAYRALAFARGETQALPGFDENVYGANSPAGRRPFGDVIDEYASVRRATLSLLSGFDDDAWERGGIANEKAISVRALAWVMAGHARHHLGVLRERYL